jgi:hypothetical protein
VAARFLSDSLPSVLHAPDYENFPLTLFPSLLSPALTGCSGSALSVGPSQWYVDTYRYFLYI